MWIVREVVNGLMYILSTGCQWRAIPKDLPPRSTLYDYFDLWSWDGTLDRIHHALYVAVPPSRLARGEPDRRDHRQPERQERGKRGPAIDPTGYDAGKKIKGKKRHILVDTQGLLMHAIVHAADIQDRDGGALLMASLFGAFPFLIKLYADGGYQGPEFQSAMKRILARVNVEIVKRSDQATGFVVAAQALDRRTHLRLARPLPTTGQGLGMPQPQGARLPAPRLHPPHAAKTMQSRMMFSDKLSTFTVQGPCPQFDLMRMRAASWR